MGVCCLTAKGLVLGADNHTCRLLTHGQSPRFINGIRLLKTEGQVVTKEKGLRNLYQQQEGVDLKLWEFQ